MELLKKLKEVLDKHIEIGENNLYPFFDKKNSEPTNKTIIDDLDMYDPIDD
jgi:hemerythrin-like domain-containing protein